LKSEMWASPSSANAINENIGSVRSKPR